jgi:hypothetical protein
MQNSDGKVFETPFSAEKDDLTAEDEE